jgi:hypothetical protein
MALLQTEKEEIEVGHENRSVLAAGAARTPHMPEMREVI